MPQPIRLYPDVPDVPEVISKSQLDELTDGQLSKARATEILNKQKELEKELKHYKKLLGKWKKGRNILRGLSLGFSISLAAGGATLAAIVSSGLALPIAIPIAMGGAAALEEVITNTILFTYVKKKIHRFKEKYDIVNNTLNRLYHFYHLAIEDKKITVEEMQEFRKLVADYENELNTMDDDVDHHMVKIKHKAESEARREVEEELYLKLKEDLKREFISKR